ncbi:hypothetical protein ACFVUN_34550 [Kitasatospora griseola]|uniref:hypothetical protein n=1 Tax=Kitasatospora griseola TaxID=2064 RepID=UPI0036DD5FB9
MATPPAPPAPTTPPTVHLPFQPPAQPSGDAPQAGPAPASSDPVAPGSLAQMLAPVAPARPVPLGSTATLGRAAEAGPDTAAGGDAAGKSGSGAASAEGPLSALVRALAVRWGRTGTATSVKRNHDVKETRVSGTSTETTNANKSDRTAKSENSAQHRSNQDARSSRDAKVADLNNKTSAQHGKSSSESKKAASTDAKASSDAKRADTRDARTSAAKDAKTSGATSDTKSAKADHSSKTAKTAEHGRAGADARTAGDFDSKGPKASGSSGGSKHSGGPGEGRSGKEGPGREGKNGAQPGSGAGKDSAPDESGDKRAKGPGPDGTDGQAGAGLPASKPGGPGRAGAEAEKPAKEEDAQGGRSKADLEKKAQAEPGANLTGTSAVGGPERERAEYLRTQAAREAGYRDGKRAAGVVGQAQAYRDGVKDGWSDRQAADEAERKRMDDAKVRNAQRPKEPPKPEMAPAAGSTTDLARKDTEGTEAGAKKPVVPPKPTTPPTIPARAEADAASEPGGRPGVDLSKKPKPKPGDGPEAGAEKSAVPPKPATPPTIPAQAKTDAAQQPKAGVDLAKASKSGVDLAKPLKAGDGKEADAASKPADRPGVDLAKASKSGVDLTKPLKAGDGKEADAASKPADRPGVDLAKASKSGDGPGAVEMEKPAAADRPLGGADSKSAGLQPMASTTVLAQAALPADQAAAAAVTGAVRPTPHTSPDSPATPRRSHDPMPDRSTASGAAPAYDIEVTPSTVRFTVDGEERELGRTEVRTLKGFENTMRTRGADLVKIAEKSKDAVAMATQHALTAQRLHERARAVKGGEDLVWALAHLFSECQRLCTKAEQTERYAARGAEAAAALVVNADSRHGGIYKAVADSPLTIPAERAFYMDQQGG